MHRHIDADAAFGGFIAAGDCGAAAKDVNGDEMLVGVSNDGFNLSLRSRCNYHVGDVFDDFPTQAQRIDHALPVRAFDPGVGVGFQVLLTASLLQETEMFRSQGNWNAIRNLFETKVTGLGKCFLGQTKAIHDQPCQTAVWVFVGGGITPLKDGAPASSRSWVFVPGRVKFLFFCHYFSCLMLLSGFGL